MPATKPQTPLDIASQAKDELELHYFLVKDLEQLFLSGNSKLHDCPKVWESILKYGFSDPIKIDPSLNEGKGGIVEGNGRTEAILWAIGRGFEPARGIKVDAEGNWALPVLVGVNQESEELAKSYSIDHNSSNLWGTGLTPLDTAKLFDWDKLSVQLEELEVAELQPLSWGEDDLEGMEDLYGVKELPTEENTSYQPPEDQPSGGNPSNRHNYSVSVLCEDEARQEEVYNLLTDEGYSCRVSSS